MGAAMLVGSGGQWVFRTVFHSRFRRRVEFRLARYIITMTNLLLSLSLSVSLFLNIVRLSFWVEQKKKKSHRTDWPWKKKKKRLLW